MKQTLTKKQTLKQKIYFHTALYDSLDILKLSNSELMQSIYEAIQENPLLDIDYHTSYSTISPDLMNLVTAPVTLKEHLYLQLHTLSIPYSEDICTYIIESLDEHGFYTEHISDTLNLLHIDEVSFLKQLHIIQSLEPAGVGAKNSIDALLLQAKRIHEPYAEQLLKECSLHGTIANIKEITNKLNFKKDDIDHALQVIKTLNPYPCSAFSISDKDIIIPDVRVEIEEDYLRISPITFCQLRYHDSYIDLMKSNPVLKKYFDESKVLLSNLNKRNATMMLVMNEIVNQQAGYFLYQDELRSLTQDEVAEHLGINQTTVSRAVMNKYYEFQDEIYPVSQLFVSTTKHGDSSYAIKKALRDIILDEDKAHPLSDQQIAKELECYDFRVSRRTIAKYREECHIPSTRERRKFIKK